MLISSNSLFFKSVSSILRYRVSIKWPFKIHCWIWVSFFMASKVILLKLWFSKEKYGLEIFFGNNGPYWIRKYNFKRKEFSRNRIPKESKVLFNWAFFKKIWFFEAVFKYFEENFLNYPQNSSKLRLFRLISTNFCKILSVFWCRPPNCSKKLYYFAKFCSKSNWKTSILR